MHTFEIASSGRSKCRACGRGIGKGELRFGERLPNPFGDGDMTHWHHPDCAAHRRPEPLLEALDGGAYDGDDADALRELATYASAHRRICRLGVAEQAPSGRARCRHCKELIEKADWRLPLIFFEEGAYSASGFIHVSCARDYADNDVWPTVAQFSRHLDEEARQAVDACYR